jgi:Rrf2 family protein
MISRTAEYALRAVVCLANNDGRPLTASQIAEASQVPADYLAKVMRALGRAKLVRSRRGLNGGFTLARQAAATTILDVINAVDPIERIERCPLGIAGHARLCPLHRRIDDAIALVEHAFAQSTVAELVGEPRKRTLCQFPCLETAYALTQ